MKKIGMTLGVVGLVLVVLALNTTGPKVMGQPEGLTEGACCVPRGFCVEFIDSFECFFNYGGVFQGVGVNCGDGCGACCLADDSCLNFVASTACPGLSGVWQGLGSTCSCPSSSCLGDINDDGIIGIDEFLFVIGNWGPCQ